MTAPTAATMIPRESTFSLVYHYIYNQVGVLYNQSRVTYNYFEDRGNMDPRNITGPTMEGRL